MQFFKGDDQEKKFYNSGLAIMDNLALQKDLFLEGAFETPFLGDVIYDSGRSPLSNAIKRDIFRAAFKEIFDAFVVAGSFESYLTVFKKIFGETSEVLFTVPAPGKLEIEIIAEEIEIHQAVSRYIQSNTYFFDALITQDGVDNLVFQLAKGFTSQYEVEQMLFELVPAGVFTSISLTIQGA